MKKIVFILPLVFTHSMFAQNSLSCEVVNSDNQKDSCILDTVVGYCFSTISIEENADQNGYTTTITRVGEYQLPEKVFSFKVIQTQSAFKGQGKHDGLTFTINASATDPSSLRVGRFVLPLNCYDSERAERKRRF